MLLRVEGGMKEQTEVYMVQREQPGGDGLCNTQGGRDSWIKIWPTCLVVLNFTVSC